MPLSKEQYEEFVNRLASKELKLSLDRNPTTLGPRYIAERIADILAAKSVVNEMAEKVELAFCEAQVRLNDLEEEIKLRTNLEYENFDEDKVGVKGAKSRDAYIWSQVEKGYIEDREKVLSPGDPRPGPFQLSEDLRKVQTEIIELKSLLKMLDVRRDELGKLDSGVRLQNKTMETEFSIMKNGTVQGKPSVPINGESDGVGSISEPDEMDDPGSYSEEAFEVEPPPIKSIPVNS